MSSRVEQVDGAGLDRERRESPLADDHRMDELDRDMPRVRPGLRRSADGEEPAAAREPHRHCPAELRQPP